MRDRAQVGPRLVFRIDALSPVGIPQESDVDGAEIDRTESGGVAGGQDLRHAPGRHADHHQIAGTTGSGL